MGLTVICDIQLQPSSDLIQSCLGAVLQPGPGYQAPRPRPRPHSAAGSAPPTHTSAPISYHAPRRATPRCAARFGLVSLGYSSHGGKGKGPYYYSDSQPAGGCLGPLP